jgi:rhodanese-related sulfurtransferase
MSREEFVRLVSTNLPEVPAYFPRDVALNREGAGPAPRAGSPPALSPEEVERRVAAGARVLDTRGAAEFGAGSVPGALNVGLSGQFASWAGTLLDPATPLVLVTADAERAAEAVTRLARVGLEDVAGWLSGGMEAWAAAGRPVVRVPQISVDVLRARLDTEPDLQVVDVRRSGEWADGHVPRAVHAPLDRLETAVEGLDPHRPTAVVCAGGYRSSTATSLLAARGFGRLVNVTGGTAAWVREGFPLEGVPARTG